MSRSVNPLAPLLSAAISAVIDDGSYETLYRRWFGHSPGSPTHPYPPIARQDFPPEGADVLADLPEPGRLRWGYALLGPPFSFVEGESDQGDARGWDLQLAELLTRTLADAYGGELEAKGVRVPAAPFPTHLFHALDGGAVDAVLSDLAVTDERKRRVDFTGPYLCATFGLLCRDEAQAARLRDQESADRPETRILVLRRAFLNELADRYLPRADKVFVDDPRDLERRLLRGEAHAALLPFASIHAYRTVHPELACPDFSIGPGAVRAVAVRKSERISSN